MKKILIYIFAALLVSATIYNTYKIVSFKGDNSQQLIKEITMLKEENNTLTNEIKTLTDEIGKLKEDIGVNKKSILDANEKIYNYKNDITSLKSRITKLEKIDKDLLECLIDEIHEAGIIRFNLRSGYSSGPIHSSNHSKCQNLIKNHKDYIK